MTDRIDQKIGLLTDEIYDLVVALIDNDRLSPAADVARLHQFPVESEVYEQVHSLARRLLDEATGELRDVLDMVQESDAARLSALRVAIRLCGERYAAEVSSLSVAVAS